MQPIVYSYESAMMCFKSGYKGSIKCYRSEHSSASKECGSPKQARRWYKAWGKEARRVRG